MMINRKYLKAIPVLLLTCLVACQSEMTVPSEAILKSFELADGFEIELIASEPHISDPVAMEIDELGRMYVIEMHGYPLNVEGNGVVKQLLDNNNDGIIDGSKTFYEGLILPTGIMRWKDGFLVTDPPAVLYLEDSDDDGVADVKEEILTGFALSNPQHNANNPIYGLDNMIYIANEGTYKSTGFEDIFGDEGDQIRFPNKSNAPKLPKNAGDLNLKFNPDTYRLEMLSGASQFGHSFNQWGHHFLTSNADHLFHEVIGSQYLQRNPDVVVPTGRQYVPDYGVGFEIYPITQSPEHQLLTDVGVITSSCGVTWYTGGLFPKEYENVAFIAEPTHNLIHTDLVYDKGATFGSKKQFEDREFLASSDAWFRPVNFYIGPSGALYILDYHRKIIEHPEWMSEEVFNSGDLYAGSTKGRIFRIIPSAVQHNVENFSSGSKMINLSTEDLIRQLENPNMWWRRNAQRLLVGRNQNGTPNLLSKYISETKSPLGTLHGLWTLDGLGVFDKELLLMALDHSEEGVRENAIRIAELHRDEFPELEAKLISMAGDPDPKVRFQLLCTLGYYHTEEAKTASQALTFKGIDDLWMQVAALSSEAFDPLAMFHKATSELGNQPSESTSKFFENLGRTLGKKGVDDDIHEFLSILTSKESISNGWWQASALNGLSHTIHISSQFNLRSRTINSLTGYFESESDPELRSASLEFLRASGYFNKTIAKDLLTKAKRVLNDKVQSEEYRVDALNILSWSPADEQEAFKSIATGIEGEQLQTAAVRALGDITGTASSIFLIDNWAKLTPLVRKQAINVFLAGEDRQEILLDAVRKGQIQPNVIGWPKTVFLLNSSNPNIRNLARSVLQGNETANDSVWLEYRVALTMIPNGSNGKEVFLRACSACHQISGADGINYGPDLAAIKNRNLSGIMIDIIKPNQSIADGYDLWIIKDKQGRTHTGIITNESVNAFTLRDAAGNEITILRNEIESISSSEISAMPQGLYRTITKQEMADLLEYLKNGISH